MTHPLRWLSCGKKDPNHEISLYFIFLIIDLSVGISKVFGTFLCEPRRIQPKTSIKMPEDPSAKSSKISLSLPQDMASFLDEQCDAFGVGRSAYFQLLLEAEQQAPRKEFVKRAQPKSR
jgi:hypothetical protein